MQDIYAHVCMCVAIAIELAVLQHDLLANLWWYRYRSTESWIHGKSEVTITTVQ